VAAINNQQNIKYLLRNFNIEVFSSKANHHGVNFNE